MQNITERSDYSYFHFSSEEDLILGLLKKDLQISRCLKEWDDFGVSTVRWPIDLADFILGVMGFPDPSDETWYVNTRDGYVKTIKEGAFSESEGAMRLFVELKKRLLMEKGKTS